MLSFKRPPTSPFYAPKTSKLSYLVSLYVRSNNHDLLALIRCRVECTRKASAEDYPRNFALIRLAEKTVERQRKEQEDEEKKR